MVVARDASPAAVKGAAALSLGALLGRPDVGDEAIRAAILERVAMDGRRAVDPDVVMEAARLRKRKAVAYLRQLVLPAPHGPLDMPVRPILRSQIAKSG